MAIYPMNAQLSLLLQPRDCRDRAWQNIQSNLSHQQAIVLEALGSRFLTRRELHDITGLEIGTLCGRLNDLMEHDPPFVKEAGKKRCTVTSQMVTVYRACK